MATGPAMGAVNVLPSAVTSTTINGVDGVLRAGSVWAPATDISDSATVYDGVFEPENQLWMNDSFWWDDDASVNATPLSLVLNLSGQFTFEQFVLQADDNDGYLLEYWDGAAWQTAASFAPVFTFGLVTRSPAVLGVPVTTDRLRLSGFGGDAYYAVSELEGYAAVPEATTWALMILGFGAAGAALRRRTAAVGTV